MRAERKMKESLGKDTPYRTIFEFSPQVIWIVDTEGKVLEVNKRVYDWLGYKPKEVVGKNFLQLPFLSKESKIIAKEKLARAFRTDNIPPYEVEFDTKTGEQRIGRIFNIPIKDKGRDRKEILVMVFDMTEQKKAEQALQKSERRYRTLTESAKDGIYIISPEGFEYVNPAFEKMFGYKAEEVCRKDFNFFDLIHPEDRKLIARREEARKKRKRLSPIYTFRGLAKKGEIKYVEVHTVPLPGEKVEILGILRDVTQRRKDEQALRESEELFRSIVENSHAGIMIVDDSYRATYINSQGCRITGYPQKEIIGQDFRKFLDEESQKLVIDRYLRRQRGEKVPSRYEFNVLRKDGKKRCVEISSTVIKDKSSQVQTVAQILDITERKQAEEALRVEKAYLDRLFESAQEGIVMSDPEGKVMRVNSEFIRLFGYKRKEVLGRNIDELVVPRKYMKNGISITNKVAAGENVGFEAIRQRKDGKLIDVSVLASPIVADDKVVAIYAIYRNITERKQAEEKIKSALNEREVMLREIHHRVKNNMQIISSLLRLQSRQIKSKKTLDLFNVGQNRIRSMALIHESLYQSSDLAKIDFSDYMKRLTTHLLSTYRVGMERIRMKLDVRDVYLDINRAIPCGLIINELVSNSLRHAFPGDQKGDVQVIMNVNKQGKYSLAVNDTGAGFPEDVDFKQTETLGMQLVIDLVNQLRGTIKLKREKGTKFRVVF
jgi:PAS domain S-box-containing protein